jgi:hypothetical protein
MTSNFMNEEEKKAIINAFWNDEELQEAITQYGEWNHTELNKIKEKVLIRTIIGDALNDE